MSPIILEGGGVSPSSGDGPRIGPCARWAEAEDLCSPCDDVYGGSSGTINPFDMDDALDMASFALFFASGQQFHGECSETIRPCTQRTYGNAGGPFIRPVVIGSRWENIASSCGCGSYDDCGCGDLEAITLPRYPIIAVTEVKVDGDVLPTTSYRVDNYSQLVRLDGEPWPCCQDLSLADTEDDTWSVTYTWGHEIPALGRKAAATLACEFYLACQPEDDDSLGECKLPRNVASLARQGVTVDFQLFGELLTPRDGKPLYFGIPVIDIFLASVNPYGVTAPSAIASPDLPPLGRRVGT